MKKMLFLLLSLTCGIGLKAQNHQAVVQKLKTCECTITSNLKIENNEMNVYTSSINNYDWEQFRLEKNKRMIRFDNGIGVLLFSKEEISNSTISSLEIEDYNVLLNNHYRPTFDKSGNIMMLIPMSNASKNTISK